MHACPAPLHPSPSSSSPAPCAAVNTPITEEWYTRVHDGFELASHSWLMVNGGQGRARQKQVKPVLLGNVGHVDLPLPALSL